MGYTDLFPHNLGVSCILIDPQILLPPKANIAPQRVQWFTCLRTCVCPHTHTHTPPLKFLLMHLPRARGRESKRKLFDGGNTKWKQRLPWLKGMCKAHQTSTSAVCGTEIRQCQGPGGSCGASKNWNSPLSAFPPCSPTSQTPLSLLPGLLSAFVAFAASPTKGKRRKNLPTGGGMLLGHALTSAGL